MSVYLQTPFNYTFPTPYMFPIRSCLRQDRIDPPWPLFLKDTPLDEDATPYTPNLRKLFHQ